jgi:hypothetical protein
MEYYLGFPNILNLVEGILQFFWIGEVTSQIFGGGVDRESVVGRGVGVEYGRHH